MNIILAVYQHGKFQNYKSPHSIERKINDKQQEKTMATTEFTAGFLTAHKKYAERVLEIIKECKRTFEVEGINYINLDEGYGVGHLREEIISYGKYVLKVQKSIYDGIIKESSIEEEFAKLLDQDSRIKLFIKLPEWYVIATPAGKYTPDWAIVVEKIKNGYSQDKIYFVVETKGTNNIYELRLEEQLKIKSAKKRFELIKDSKFVAPIKDFDSFEKEW